MKFLRTHSLRTMILIVVVCCGRGPSLAQNWVKDMFEQNMHDFGNVPRGAKTEYRFTLTNIYEEDLHVASVRSSCGCTMPRIEKETLKTYEKGAIVCEFNTRSFIGTKSAVVTVVFDRPHYGEMQLMVKGNIRSDIVTEPGEIQFGSVDQGMEKRTAVKVSYAGTNQWRIQDVRSTNTHLGVSLQRVENGQGRVEYEMRVRLKESAPAGDFNDQIVLVTNDQRYNLVTIPVRGDIVPPLVMPVSVPLGTVTAGETVSDRMIIKGKQPFEVVKVECDDPRFSFQTPNGAKIAHIIPIKFEADNAPGAFKERIIVHTSLSGGGTASTFISGNVSN